MKCKKNLDSQESVIETGMCNHLALQLEMAFTKVYSGLAPIIEHDTLTD